MDPRPSDGHTGCGWQTASSRSQPTRLGSLRACRSSAAPPRPSLPRAPQYPPSMPPSDPPPNTPPPPPTPLASSPTFSYPAVHPRRQLHQRGRIPLPYTCSSSTIIPSPRPRPPSKMNIVAFPTIGYADVTPDSSDFEDAPSSDAEQDLFDDEAFYDAYEQLGDRAATHVAPTEGSDDASLAMTNVAPTPNCPVGAISIAGAAVEMDRRMDEEASPTLGHAFHKYHGADFQFTRPESCDRQSTEATSASTQGRPCSRLSHARISSATSSLALASLDIDSILDSCGSPSPLLLPKTSRSSIRPPPSPTFSINGANSDPHVPSSLVLPWANHEIQFPLPPRSRANTNSSSNSRLAPSPLNLPSPSKLKTRRSNGGTVSNRTSRSDSLAASSAGSASVCASFRWSVGTASTAGSSVSGFSDDGKLIAMGVAKGMPSPVAEERREDEEEPRQLLAPGPPSAKEDRHASGEASEARLIGGKLVSRAAPADGHDDPSMASGLPSLDDFEVPVYFQDFVNGINSSSVTATPSTSSQPLQTVKSPVPIRTLTPSHSDTDLARFSNSAASIRGDAATPQYSGGPENPKWSEFAGEAPIGRHLAAMAHARADAGVSRTPSPLGFVYAPTPPSGHVMPDVRFPLSQSQGPSVGPPADPNSFLVPAGVGRVRRNSEFVRNMASSSVGSSKNTVHSGALTNTGASWSWKKALRIRWDPSKPSSGEPPHVPTRSPRKLKEGGPPPTEFRPPAPRPSSSSSGDHVYRIPATTAAGRPVPSVMPTASLTLRHAHSTDCSASPNHRSVAFPKAGLEGPADAAPRRPRSGSNVAAEAVRPKADAEAVPPVPERHSSRKRLANKPSANSIAALRLAAASFSAEAVAAAATGRKA